MILRGRPRGKVSRCRNSSPGQVINLPFFYSRNFLDFTSQVVLQFLCKEEGIFEEVKTLRNSKEYLSASRLEVGIRKLIGVYVKMLSLVQELGLGTGEVLCVIPLLFTKTQIVTTV